MEGLDTRLDSHLFDIRDERERQLELANKAIWTALAPYIKSDLSRYPADGQGLTGTQHVLQMFERLQKNAPHIQFNDVQGAVHRLYEDGWIEPIGAEGYLYWRVAKYHQCRSVDMGEPRLLSPARGSLNLETHCTVCGRAWRGRRLSSGFIDWWPADDTYKRSDFV